MTRLPHAVTSDTNVVFIVPTEESHILQKWGGGAVIGSDSNTLYVGSYIQEVRDYWVFAEHRVRVTVMIIYRLTYGCGSWWKRYVCRSWVAVRRAFDVWSR